MDIKDLLTEARALLVDKGWCQGVSARDPHGFTIGVFSEKAFSFCVIGSLYKVVGDTGDPDVVVATRALQSAVGVSTSGELAQWNDLPGRTREEVIDAFDRAIAAQG